MLAWNLTIKSFPFSQIKLALIILLSSFSSSFSEDRWVTDEFEVMMRSDKGSQKKIIRQLKSGTKLEVLETDKAQGYSYIRLASGKEGWVLSRYLQSEPTARLRLPSLESQFESIEGQRDDLQLRLNDLDTIRANLLADLASLEANNSVLRDELDQLTALSSSSIQLNNENSELKNKLLEVDSELKNLIIENRELIDRSSREWFLIGAIVLVAGLLLGLILPRIRWRKKVTWSDF
ncbi:MAG: TIGR04211 family SH3 domain-containing protein [Pseudomonadota bacterium]|nr:TIGR04211 family SH3 domain-containing protein [Pseudomonadota bacterium]